MSRSRIITSAASPGWHLLERCEQQRALALGGMTGGRAGELLRLQAAADHSVEGLR